MALLIVTDLLVLLEAFEKTQLTQTVVTNNSDNTIKYKPEHESEPTEIARHSSVEGVDCIKVSGKVFKACSGTHISIDTDGRIHTEALSGKVANIIRGGFITTSPDATWDKIFQAN